MAGISRTRHLDPWERRVMSHDQFLLWLSERGTGSWESFKAAHSWLFGQASQDRRPRPSWTAYLLSSLGHLEVDWRDGAWSATAPCVAGLPSAGATAVLVGSRPKVLIDRVTRYSSPDVTLDLMSVEHSRADGPTGFYIQYESAPAVEMFSARIGARFEPAPAARLSRTLPSIDSFVASARITADPPRGYSVERLDPVALTWVTHDGPLRLGLYKYKGYGVDQFRFFDGTATRDVDRDVGVWATLRAAGVRAVRYEREEINGTLVVPWIARLPLLQARTAVLCSGLPPRGAWGAPWIRYVNVPRSIARRIASSLGQELLISEGTSA